MADIIVGPQRGLGFRVEQIWAGLVVHADSDEAVPAIAAPGSGLMMPLIAADHARLEWLRKAARHIARSSGKPVRIVCFRIREDQELIEP